MSNAISISGLRKRYGRHDALVDVNLNVPTGSAYALLGKNGAGKTTLLNCVLGLTAATAGHVLFDGKPLQWRMFERIAYVPDGCALYESLSIGDHVQMFAGQLRSFDRAYAAATLARFELTPRLRIGALSRGQKAAVALALAFAGKPELLLLDEPTAGLDPGAQRTALDLIVESSNAGATILLSSHNVAQLERVADHIAILRDGVIALDGPLEDILSRHRLIEAVLPIDAPTPPLDGIGLEAIQRIGPVLRVFATNADRTQRALSGASVDVIKVSDCSLEDVYFAHTGYAALAEEVNRVL